MFKFYSYEVFGELDNEIIKFCKENNLGCSNDGRLCCFVGEKKDLEKLHDTFFDDYTFNIEEKTLKNI
jgi:hypothetical protein